MKISLILSRIVIFTIALAVGIGSSSIFPIFEFSDSGTVMIPEVEDTDLVGIISCPITPEFLAMEEREAKLNAPLQVLSATKPEYTEIAREKQIQGVVRLLVTFQADAKIGKISQISGLPDGLTEKAISSARQIKFIPEKRDGKRITIRKAIEYRFTIY